MSPTLVDPEEISPTSEGEEHCNGALFLASSIDNMLEFLPMAEGSAMSPMEVVNISNH